MKKNNKQKKRTTQNKQLTQEKKIPLFRSLVQIISIPSKTVHFIIATFAVVLGFFF